MPQGRGGRLRKGRQMESDLLTASEAGRFLRLSLPAVYTAVCRGQLPVCRLGRRLRFRRADLEKHIASRAQEPTQAPDPSGRKGRG